MSVDSSVTSTKKSDNFDSSILKTTLGDIRRTTVAESINLTQTTTPLSNIIRVLSPQHARAYAISLKAPKYAQVSYKCKY